MPLIKFKNQNWLFPSCNKKRLSNFLSSDDFFNNDHFEDEISTPAMNVKEHDEDFEIEFVVSGFSKKEIEFTLDHNILNVCGEKKLEEE